MKISILTYCSGYEYEIYRRFVGTLFDTGFNGDVYFFIKSTDKSKLDKLQEEYKDKKIYYIETRSPYNVQSYRYRLYFDFLKRSTTDEFKDVSVESPTTMGVKDTSTESLTARGFRGTAVPLVHLILLCDSRDVLFQINPENYPFKVGVDLYLFQEGKRIEECYVNSNWIQAIDNQIKGENIMETVKTEPIICSGTTLGTREGIIRYLERMVACMSRLPYRVVNIHGIDQGVHNYLVYCGHLSDLKVEVLTNLDNLVNTILYGFKGIKDNKIINENGESSYIVHQYDRLDKELLKSISGKYNFLL